jgi:limonene-1,2-epoxide hydrolase
VVREYFRRLFEERDLSVCDELLASDYIDHDAAVGTPAGPAATRAYVGQMLADVTDLAVDLHEIHGDGAAVMVRATWRGTRDGVRFEQAGLALIHVTEAGQLRERWSAYQPVRVLDV